MTDRGALGRAGAARAREHAGGHPRPTTPAGDREQQVLDRIDRARRRRPKVREERITMSHGAGRQGDPDPDRGDLPGRVPQPAARTARGRRAAADLQRPRVALTTDSYVVSPLFFPGGDIGDLAINGTVNDLAVTGAPAVPVGRLHPGGRLPGRRPEPDRRVDASRRRGAGVQVVTGDTKVVQRGKADGCYINTAGVGVLDRDVRPRRGERAAGGRDHRVRPDRRSRGHDHAGPG